MKTIYKTLTLGVILTAVAFAAPAFGQDVCANIEANTTLYKKYTDNYKGSLEQKKIALKAGNEYLEKYPTCTDFTAQLNWIKKNIDEKLGPAIVTEEEAIAKEKRYARFNTAVKADNGPEIFASGEDILKFEPDLMDVMIVLAGAGLDEAAVKNNDTFNGKAINYAKEVIKRIGDGTKSEKYGALDYEYKTKENALGWMNYTIGYIQYYRQKQTDGGLDYFYKSTQFDSGTKTRDFIYAIVGDSYRNKAVALNDEIAKMIERDQKETFESKSKLALSKGYVDRAIDAYSRAYDFRKANLQSEKNAVVKQKIQTSLDELYETLKSLYKFRYETIENPILDSDLPVKLNSHIATVIKTEFVSPKAVVEPVDPPNPDEEKAEGNASTTTTGTTTPMPVKPKVSPSPMPPTSKATTTGASVKSDADKTGNKPKKKK